MRIVRVAAVTIAAVLVGAAPAYACPTATINGSFSDGCRDFAAHSSKDISYVELHYVDGRVVKDERIRTRDWATSGAAGDEIAVAIVKSGVTRKSFSCEAGGPPVAVLEIRLSPQCQPFTSGDGDTFYWCNDGTSNPQRTVFVDPGDLRIDMGCLPADPLCQTITLRATGSSDPDGDLASWSIAFGDGTVASGGWAAGPPDEVTHGFGPTAPCAFGAIYCDITLSVTDSQGRSDTDRIDLAFFDTSPD
jgi:hypothetical protein